jgi:nucleoside-diphosphate-sugar epimerase
VKVLVTGAAGFIGRHAIRELLARGHEVVAVVRDPARIENFEWRSAVRVVVMDIHQPLPDPRGVFGSIDLVMHLAWHGLPNYRAAFHVEENLPRDFAFLRSLVAAGYDRLLVTGTCFECFPEGGRMAEDRHGSPTLPYPLAKATLRRQLEALQAEVPFSLQWVRLFYMYGAGQNPGSLLAQLDRAIDVGAASFDMSGGEQLRDYLPVTAVAAKLATVAVHPEWTGVTHICNGSPISVRQLVEQHVAARRSSIVLNLGAYPYADYEPMAFWGASARPWP